jgi:hypothetical protein
MPTFELYNADGTLQLDLSSRITKVLGTLYITGAGSLSNAGLAAGTLFYVFNVTGQYIKPGYPTITQNGTTISWTAPPSPVHMTYGIY